MLPISVNVLECSCQGNQASTKPKLTMNTYKITTPGYPSYEKQFKNDDEMFGYLVGCDDDSRSFSEKLIDGVWCYFDATVCDWVIPGTLFKCVGYAYPTSDRAEELGFGSEGCYFTQYIYNHCSKTKNGERGYRLYATAGRELERNTIPWLKTQKQNEGKSFYEIEKADMSELLKHEYHVKDLSRALASVNRKHIIPQNQPLPV